MRWTPSFIAIAGFALLFFSPGNQTAARADGGCNPQPIMTQYGYANLCQTGIPSAELDVSAIPSDRQYYSEWCWAASISGVFAYYGHSISQQHIVQQAYGGIFNLPGTPDAIMQSLNRTWTDDDGDTFTATASYYSSTWATAAQDLAKNDPLIVASLGHAMILTAVSYLRYPSSAGIVQTVTVRDPWPLSPERRNLSPQEIAGTVMLIRIRVH